MKKLNSRSAVCHCSAPVLSACKCLNSAVPFSNALRYFYFVYFAFIFSRFPICKS